MATQSPYYLMKIASDIDSPTLNYCFAMHVLHSSAELRFWKCSRLENKYLTTMVQLWKDCLAKSPHQYLHLMTKYYTEIISTVAYCMIVLCFIYDQLPIYPLRLMNNQTNFKFMHNYTTASSGKNGDAGQKQDIDQLNQWWFRSIVQPSLWTASAWHVPGR